MTLFSLEKVLDVTMKTLTAIAFTMSQDLMFSSRQELNFQPSKPMVLVSCKYKKNLFGLMYIFLVMAFHFVVQGKI